MNRTGRHLMVLLILALTTSLSAQRSQVIDSLRQLVARAAEDTSKVRLLTSICYQYSNELPDSAIAYCNRAIALARRINDPEGEAMAHNDMGIAYDSKGDLEKSLEQYFISLRISQQHHHPKEIASSYNDIGIIYFEMARYDSALYYLFEALQLKDSLGLRKSLANSYSNIALVYSDQGYSDKSIDYLYKALAIDEEFKNQQGIADSYLNIGTLYKNDANYTKAMETLQKAEALQLAIDDKEGLAWTYNEIGECQLETGEYQKAMESYQRGLAKAEEIDLKIMIGNAHYGMGRIYFLQKDYAKSLDEHQHALDIANEVGDTKAVIKGYIGIGNVHLGQHKINDAIDRFQQSLILSKSAGFMVGIRDSYQGLSQAYEAKNDPVRALDHYKLFTTMNDSLLNIEKQEKVALLHTQYETLKKDEEIALLQTKNQLQASENRKEKIVRNAFITGFVLVLALAFLLFYNYRLKNLSNRKLASKNKVIEEQKLQVEAALSELQESEKQLIQAEKMSSLGQLTAGIAHEINNPINFVSANIKPLKRNFSEMKELLERYEHLLEGTDKKEEYVKLRKDYDIEMTMSESDGLMKGIEEGSKRTAEIVKGLRNFSRLDESEMKKTNINEGIESTLLLLQNKFDHQHIEIIKHLNEIPEIDAYAGQINQVLMNLLTNAVDAIGNYGKIFIHTSVEDSKLKVSIRDTGIGMTEDIKRKIFDPFFTTKEVGKGTGMGLSISYGIIEKHKGQIDVNSEVGKGTEFIFWLPLVKEGQV